jgi:pimeloyl-ACP methyl ester carboxylesterase
MTLDVRLSRRYAGGLALGLAGAGALTARHLRRLRADPELTRLSSPLRGRTLTARSADGTVLHAEAFGPESGPTIVLVPGWTELLTSFDYLTRDLIERGFRVLAYDLRGQGRSGPGHDDDYQIERYGEDLEAVLAAGAPDRARTIVAGHSLGAMSIAAWAVDHDVRERVSGAALINTGLDGLISNSKLLPAVLPAVVHRPLATHSFMGNPLPMPPFSTPLSHAIVRYAAFGPTATDAQVAFYERMLIACSPKVRAAAGLAMAEMDLLHATKRLTVPTLVVAGAADRLTPPSHSRRIAASLPELERLLVLPGIGHMSQLEAPAELSQALTELWTAVNSAAVTLTA